MREIKFRVWNSDDLKMEFPIVIALCNDGVTKPLVKCSDGNRAYKDYLLMQYIGLKDKNEREIYEGDIVKVNNQYSVIEFREGGFYCNNSDYSLNTIWFKAGKPLVVGNIHQNKMEEFI